jgi:hypothetical protein
LIRRYGESEAHTKAKYRIGEILHNKGWQVWIDEYTFKCQTAKGERNYTPDVYAESPDYQSQGLHRQVRHGNSERQAMAEAEEKRGNRILQAESSDYSPPDGYVLDKPTEGQGVPKCGHRAILEVQGSKGKGNHSTKHHRGKDTNRMEDIRSNHGMDITYVPLWDWEIKGFTDQEVWEQIEYRLRDTAKRQRLVSS